MSQTITEEVKDLVPDSVADKADVEMSQTITEEVKDLVPDSVADKADVEMSQTITEEVKDLVPDSVADKADVEMSQTITEEVKDLVPDSVADKADVETSQKRRLGVRSLFKNQRQKKRKIKSRREPEWMRIFTLAITLVSMLLALSIMPLFPQPLPAVLAFSNRFCYIKKTRIGNACRRTVNWIRIDVQFSKIKFYRDARGTEIRWIVVFLFIILFTGLPIVFRDRKSAIVINLGIIAAIYTFFQPNIFSCNTSNF